MVMIYESGSSLLIIIYSANVYSALTIAATLPVLGTWPTGWQTCVPIRLVSGPLEDGVSIISGPHLGRGLRGWRETVAWQLRGALIKTCPLLLIRKRGTFSVYDSHLFWDQCPREPDGMASVSFGSHPAAAGPSLLAVAFALSSAGMGFPWLS